MIYISNWHTSYSELLSKVFKKAIIFRKWDFDQRDFPKNFRHLSLFKVILKIKRSDILICNKAIYDLPVIIFALLKKAKIVIVLHGEITRASSGFKLKIKTIFYKILSLVLIDKERSFVCIQNSVRKSFGFKDAHVIQPFLKLREKSEINLQRAVVVANNISRDHFDKEFLIYIHQNIAPITIIGRDNSELQEKYPFNFCVPKNKTEFLNEIKKGGICINCLIYPEASYNLGILDCISVGMPIISIYRENILFNKGSFILEKNAKSLKELNKNIFDETTLNKKIEILRNKAKSEFGFSDFKKKWVYVIQ